MLGVTGTVASRPIRVSRASSPGPIEVRVSPRLGPPRWQFEGSPAFLVRHESQCPRPNLARVATSLVVVVELQW